MSNLRRFNIDNHPYFITSVTYEGRPHLVHNIELFWDAIAHVKGQSTFELVAWVVLPDHFLIFLTKLDSTISEIMRCFKSKYSGLYRSKNKLTKGRLWQHRFWEHVVRDESDLRKHLDYIHYNPVKHKLVESPFKYNHSSIYDFQKDGIYESDWGTNKPDIEGIEFGE